MTRLSLLFLLVPFCALPLTAQELYNVRVGTFQDVKADDFINIRELGFVYGLAREGQLTDVYLGNYSSREKAESITATLQERGFRNAASFALPSGAVDPRPYVQIALRGRNRSLDWRALERAGKLYVDAADGVTKVVTGPYASAEAANAALPDIRALGFTDAFVKSLSPKTLIPVGVFETGIKKPLIPIELRQVEPPTEPAALPPPTVPQPGPTAKPTAPVDAPPPAAPASAPAPATPPRQTVDAAAPPPASVPAPPAASVPPPALLSAEMAGMPAIDVKTKRHSAAELQRVLKEKGFYDGSIDGLYGSGTELAYKTAWARLPELRKYRLLAAADYAPSDAKGNTPLSWPEMEVLQTIADDLAAGLDNVDLASELENQRAALVNATETLGTPVSREALNWETSLWESLNAWAEEDPLHARILTALRISYYQSQARLEAMYQQRGLSSIEARNLATATLRNLLSAPLERFG